MSYLPPEKPKVAEEDAVPSWAQLTSTREQIVGQLKKKPVCDLLIIGGGIAGATLARLAAFNGLRTVLLERGDYAGGTSGRSSKMAHGGLRYLEMFDFKQVFEGVRAREDLYETAPHLVRPHEFLIPIKNGDLFSRIKYSLGLRTYDLLARSSGKRRFKWIPRERLDGTMLAGCRERLAGAFSFYDGIMDDARLVLENIIAARQEGAIALNYAEFLSFDVKRDGSVQVGWRDLRTNTNHELKTGLIANCAGAWATTAGRLSPSPDFGEVRYSRGVHLLFRKKWDGAAILIPQPERKRNYFIWPHPGGTMVGTTDRPAATPEWDPVPTEDEVSEILGNLAKDFPESGLDRSSLHYGFAGLRTLPVRSGQTGATSAISRRHRWVHTQGMLTLLGGKYTSAAWAAMEGLKKVFELSDVISPLVPVAGRKLPGAGGFPEISTEFIQKALSHGVPLDLASRALARFGSRVRHFELLKDPFEVLGGIALKGEVALAVRTEQVEGLEDLLRRRLGIEFEPGAGLEGVDAVASYLAELLVECTPSQEVLRYRERIEKVRAILSKAPRG